MSSVPVSSTPFADTFPQATHVLPIVFSIGQPTSYQYFKVSNDKLEMVASYAGAGISGSKDYTPNLKTQMIFPFSYGDTTSDTYQKVGYSPDVVGLKYYGYGTLIMPDRTYNDVVLIKNSYGSDNDYAWVTLNPLVPVLNYTYDNNQLIYIGAVPTSVEDRNAHAAYRVYPNPAQGHIMASLPTGQAGKDVQFSLTNAFGQTILQAPLRQETTSIDASHLAPGIYFYTIATGGQPVAAGKLCIR